MKKEDYMFLPKKRLAELLEERDNLEEKIEEVIAKKLSELYLRPLQLPPNTPKPFQPPFEPISVLYGCPTNDKDIRYGIVDKTSITTENI
jgi:hypothetical protein